MVRRLTLSFLVLLALPAASAGAATFTVTNTLDSGAGSLRQAIVDSEAVPTTDAIVFDIPGPAPHVINVASAYPVISSDGKLTIDATTQPGYAGSPVVQIDGVATSNQSGLNVSGDGYVVRGLSITRFSAGLSTFNGVIVEGNWLGVRPDGVAAGNTARGIGVGGSGAQIGGTTAAARNVVSGNNVGIEVGTASGVTVQGNYVGLNPAGTAAMPNTLYGVYINGSQAGVVIGGSAAGAGNVISGNGSWGVVVAGAVAGTKVQGNRIGRPAVGFQQVSNMDGGLEVLQNGAIIGGTAAGEGNTISGNNGRGVVVGGSGTGNLIRGNLIRSNGTTTQLDLGNDGPTGNDAGDGDTGADGLQNFPTIGAATSTPGALTVPVTLSSKASRSYAIDLFSTDFCSPEANAEYYLGSVTITTDGSGTGTVTQTTTGTASIEAVGPTRIEEGGTYSYMFSNGDGPFADGIVATATDSVDGTSEMSPCFATDRTGLSTVHVATVDGTAHANVDYIPQVFDWQRNHSGVGGLPPSLQLPTIDDSVHQGDRTFTLTIAAVSGTTLGSPSSVQFTIVDNDPEPAAANATPTVVPPGVKPSPVLDGKPTTTIARLRAGLRASKLKRLTGTARDDRGVARVEVAIVRLGGGAKASAAKASCRQLGPKGTLVTLKPKKGRCAPTSWRRAKGTRSWALGLTHRLPAGRYAAYARAIDTGGQRGAVTRRAFTLK